MAPPKVRRRVTGKAEKLRPYAVFCGGTFPHADSLPGPGLLRTARPGRLRAVTLPQGPPLRKELVESVTMIPATLGMSAPWALNHTPAVCAGLWTWGGSTFVSSGAAKSSILF